jgi:hypothetical protein
VKPGLLFMLLLAGCGSPEPDGLLGPSMREYTLTWTCQSTEGCERAGEVQRIDSMECVDTDCSFRSTQDESFKEECWLITGSELPADCIWLYYVTLFGQDLERSRYCYTPAGFELQLSIPNEDPATYSMWLVDGRLAGL